MSGIAGIIHFDGAPVAPGLIEKMTGAMTHRGPDGIHHWVLGSVALGQCMLRTTPESLQEHQPLANEDASVVLVMDGRVDNYEDLRRELLTCGAVLRTRSDAELVLRAYECWGEQCPDRIIGEFAFFVWDARQRRLFGSRDAAGTRHFHYHAGNGWFAFASEIKGLLAPGLIEPRLNESRLLDYLVDEFDRDDEVGTFYEGIDRMPAGNAMSVTPRGTRIWRYWDPAALSAHRFDSMDECAEAFLEHFRVAVKCRLRNIGPVGAMLSGGLDSSSIVGLIRKEFRHDLQQPLRTFSLVREDRENCSDWRGVQEMLKGGWIQPTIITSDLTREDCLALFDGIRHLDEPFALSQGLTDTILVDSAARNGCRVILDGMAGDLLFFSPERSLGSIVRNKLFTQVPSIVRANRRHALDGGLRKLAWLALREAAPERARAAWRSMRDRRATPPEAMNASTGDLSHLLHDEIAANFLPSRRGRRHASQPRAGIGNDQSIHASRFTSGLLAFAHEVNGQIALSRGVEPRSPYSDRRLIEFAIRMPVEAKLAAPWYKHLLRRSMADILPDDVRWRRTIGEHPGWKFRKTIIAQAAAAAPEIWNSDRLSDILSRWIDASRLQGDWNAHRRTGNAGTGNNLLTAAILAQWLESHRFASRSP